MKIVIAITFWLLSAALLWIAVFATFGDTPDYARGAFLVGLAIMADRMGDCFGGQK